VEPGPSGLHDSREGRGCYAVPAFRCPTGILMTMHRHSNVHRTIRRLAPAILALVFLATGLLPGGATSVLVVAAADVSSDIPGVALPGPVAAGRLGGAIYDVVYRLSVAPGYVIVASLTGTAGTDFDMYLFDATARTVLSSVGLLTKSNGPTSTESISWPSRLGGTYYIDLNGATDVEGDYRLTLQTVPDPTPPVVSIVLAGDRGSINQLTVPVTLAASDDLSGVSEMAFSTDGLTYNAWEPFVRSTTWTFTPGDGPRTLWAKVRNGVGLDSLPTSASVTIDETAPSAADLAPAPGSSVVGLRPTFTVRFNEAMDPTTWTDLGLIVQSASGALLAGAYAYDVDRRVGSFIPSSDLTAGITYVVTLGDVRDVAGNRVSSLGSWSIMPLAPVDLQARLGSNVLLFGQSTRLDLTMSGAPVPASLDVSYSSGGSAEFVPLTTIEMVNGRQSLVVTPERNTTYRFRYSGAFGVAPAVLDVPVLVRRSVVLAGRNGAVVSVARAGASVRLTAAIGPSAAGVSVSFRLYRFDAARRVWVYAGSRGRNTDTAGRAVYSWVPATPGSWYVRAAVASTADFANNVSPVYRWSVGR